MAKALTTAALDAMARRVEHEPDEDDLDREDGDIAETVVMSLVRCLADSGPAGVHLLRKLIDSLDDMADAVMERDHAGLEDAAADAHEVLAKLVED
jgi:hypothetical protein